VREKCVTQNWAQAEEIGVGQQKARFLQVYLITVYLAIFSLFEAYIISNRRIISEWKEITKSWEVVVIYVKHFSEQPMSLLRLELDFFSNRNRKRYSLCHLAWFLFINKLFSARIQGTYLLLIL
jgi:hypothetical protein